MKKQSILKKVLYVLSALIIVLAASIWVFLTYYFQETLNSVLIPKIRQSVFTATHGRFVLSLDSISYSNGTFTGNAFLLTRVARDSNEHGLGLEILSIDTVRFEGINWWDIVRGKDVKLTSLMMNAPKLFAGDLDSNSSIKQLSDYDSSRVTTSAINDLPVISFDSIVLDKSSVFLPKPSGKSIVPEYHNIKITLRNFLLDTKSAQPHQPFFSKQVEFDLPYGIYSVSDSLYSLEVHGIHASLIDSLVTVDSFSYRPNYTEQEFANLHKYIQGQLSFGCKGIALRGLDFKKMLELGSYHASSCEAASWNVEYYGDRRKPKDPHPPDAVLPHVIINSITTPILIDSIIMNNGLIRHRERVFGSVRPSLITFTKARVSTTAFCTDSTNPTCNEPLKISVNALFMGQGRIIGVVSYPIHQNAFDLQVDATVGPFDMTVLNSYLVTNERKEVSQGSCLGGELHMSVHSGKATTTVSPRYKDLSMKILATDVHKSRGIFEGIKSFIANAFILRTKNIDTPDKKAFSGTTNYTYSKKEEFFEFLWLALRRSIGKVAGF